MSGLIEDAAEHPLAGTVGGPPFRFNANAARAVLKPYPLRERIAVAQPARLRLEERVVRLEGGAAAAAPEEDAWLGSAYDTEQLERPAFSATSKRVLQGIVAVFLAWQLGITIAFAVLGYYDVSMFTFWNYTLLTVFFAWLLAALVYERWLLTGVLLFALPVLLGTTFVVWVAIVIIVARNANVFLGDDGTSVAKRHTGDWIVHDVPLAMMLITLSMGFAMYARRALGYRERLFRSRTRRLAYLAYWLLSPLVPLGIYSLAFDIAEKYPTGIHTGVLWVMLVGLCVAWQALSFGAFSVNADVAVRLHVFAAPVRRQRAVGAERPPAPAHAQEGRATLHGLRAVPPNVSFI